jgi:predicted MFS family arabinose efflux permease
MTTQTDAVPVQDGPTPDAPAGMTAQASTTRWGALTVMMATAFVLVTAEFLPGGLLTPIAQELGITTGQAAQTITVTALVGFLVAPTVGILVPSMDRRRLLVILALVGGLSSVGVALASSFWLMLLARVLLGAALSGYWAMMLVIAIRLTRPERLGRGVMLVTAGTSLATVAGVPVAVLVANASGWRAAFVIIGALTLAVALLLALVLPPIPAAAGTGLRRLLATARGPMARGLAGHVLTVLGHFTAYAFIRVALERIDGVDVATLTWLLALFGVGGLVGNLVVGALVDRHLGALAYAVPTAMALGIAVLATSAPSLPLIAAAVTLWGAAIGGWLIVVNGWTSRRLPSEQVEAGSGLVVAGFQLSIMLGAGVGGLVVDAWGVTPTFLLAATMLVAGAVVFGHAARTLGATPSRASDRRLPPR